MGVGTLFSGGAPGPVFRRYNSRPAISPSSTCDHLEVRRPLPPSQFGSTRAKTIRWKLGLEVGTALAFAISPESNSCYKETCKEDFHCRAAGESKSTKRAKSKGLTMAFVVPTPPPDLVVKTRVKKGRTGIEESPVLCDTFWACVLDDYLDDDESGVLDTLTQQHLDALRKKHRSKKMREHKKQHIGGTKTISEEQETQELARELDILLAGSGEMDQREKEVHESVFSDDIVSDLRIQVEKLKQAEHIHLVKVRETGPEVEANRGRKQKMRAQRSLTEYGQRSSAIAESSPELEPVDSVTDKRATRSSAVYHYAPLGHEQQALKNRLALGHLNRHSRDSLPGDLNGDTRVPRDPEEKQLVTSRGSRFHGDDQMDYPRNPSIVDPPHRNARPSVPRRDRVSVDRKSGAILETIDLTDEGYHDSSLHARSDEWRNRSKADPIVRSMVEEDPVEWLIRSSQRGDADYRRRKLDRKEALDRIRIIKARLNTVDA